MVDLPNKQVWLHRRPTGTRYLDVQSVNAGAITLLEVSVEVNVNNLFEQH